MNREINRFNILKKLIVNTKLRKSFFIIVNIYIIHINHQNKSRFKFSSTFIRFVYLILFKIYSNFKASFNFIFFIKIFIIIFIVVIIFKSLTLKLIIILNIIIKLIDSINYII